VSRPSTTRIDRVIAPSLGTNVRPATTGQILAKVQPGVVDITTNSGAGTGMLLTPDGEVLTNYHVVAGASSIKVTLYGETRARKAILLGAAKGKDVALLKIDRASSLPTVSLGSSSRLQVGEPVVAIGNALNLAGGPTVTSGIVSATNRNLSAQDPTLPTDLLQTDAAINAGNSGGPLANGDGDVVGMNTLVLQQAGVQQSAQNLGFAIPVDDIKPLLPQLARGVTTAPAFLGVGVTTFSPSPATGSTTSATHGALVQHVQAGGPAARAGVRQNDVIISFDGKDVTSDSGLVALIAGHRPGDRVRLVIGRGQTTQALTVTLGARPDGTH
jgi:S1-C subfamily serine protease